MRQVGRDVQICRDTAGFGAVSGCVIYVGGLTPPSDEDWEAYLEFLRPRLSSREATPRVVWDDSGGPSPLNRRKLVALTKDCPLKVAIVSDAKRTVSTVLNWQRDQPAYRDFRSDELRQAVAFVGIQGQAALDVVLALRALRTRVLVP